MRKIFKEIIGVIGLIYSVAVVSIALYHLLFVRPITFEVQHIFGLILHVTFIYYCWHWMNGIIFFDDDQFLKEKDPYYKEAEIMAQEGLGTFIEQINEESEVQGLVFIRFTNYRKKKVKAWAIVIEVKIERKKMLIDLIKFRNPDVQEDYTRQMISYSDIIDWIIPKDENTFEGGFLMKARIKKADDKGYGFDYDSEDIVRWIRNNSV